MDKQALLQSFLSIRNRILIFAILATLVPSIGMGLLLNSMMHTTITEKIEQKLLDSGSIIEREISLWFKERNYDLRVFSGSYIIVENFVKFSDEAAKNPSQNFKDRKYYKNLVTYLTSVQNQFEYYTRLFVFDTEGNVIAASKGMEGDDEVRLPPDALDQITTTGYFRGEVYFKEKNNKPYMLIGTPVFSEINDKKLGILAIELQLQNLIPLLDSNLFKTKSDSPVTGSLIRMIDGMRFIDIGSQEKKGASVTMSQEIMELFENPGTIQVFRDHQGNDVVGIVVPLKGLNWGLVISESYDAVYAKLTSSRNRNIIIALCFTLIIGVAAFHFSTRIVKPLTALTRGAMQVAGGDLDVRLPIYINDEIGLTTKVFNKMVVELHQSHNKLQELATTDSLTGLANRKRIMEILQSHFDHYKRYKTPFSILMVDIDFFKNINDTYGHMAGDAVLKQVAGIFRKSLRNVDYHGRYGGEEFLMVLPETGGDEARNSAERIRQSIESHIFLYEKKALKVTVSIGVATVLDDDKSEEDLIKRADDSLYQAKDTGRNQVVVGGDIPRADEEKVVSISSSVKK